MVLNPYADTLYGSLMHKKIPLSRIRDAAAGDRPKLFAWMIANHDTFLAELKKAVCPDWASLASMFNAEGRTNAHGRPVTAITAERAWRRARKTMEERRVSKPKKHVGRPKPPAPGVVHSVGVSKTDDEESPKFSFKPAKIK